MDVWEFFRWLNPLDSLYDAIADKLGFPVDQVSTKSSYFTQSAGFITVDIKCRPIREYHQFYHKSLMFCFCFCFCFFLGPLRCPIVPELPSCLHSPSPSPSLPHTTDSSLCLLAGPGALLWLQLFRCADADPVWDCWSLLPHVDLPSSDSCTEVS